jgi:hypothetical protein
VSTFHTLFTKYPSSRNISILIYFLNIFTMLKYQSSIVTMKHGNYCSCSLSNLLETFLFCHDLYTLMHGKVCIFHNLLECSKYALLFLALPPQCILVSGNRTIACRCPCIFCALPLLVLFFTCPCDMVFSSFDSYAPVFNCRFLVDIMHPCISSFFFTLLVVVL